MKTWAVLLLVVMATIVMAAVAMEDEGNEGDWLDNFVEEYKRRPRPPPRQSALKTPVRRSELEKMKRSCDSPWLRGMSQASCIQSLMRQLAKPYSCTGYGKPCTIRNRQHGCCGGMGCYGGQGNDCTRNKNCICRRTPELKYVYYMV